MFDAHADIRSAIDDSPCVAPTAIAGDRHAFDQREGIAFHDHAVGEGAAVAFVGVADDISAVGLRVGDGLPFDAGRKARAAAPAQAGFRHFGDGRRGADLDGALQAAPARQGGVIVQRNRIDHAAAGEGQARLARRRRDGLRSCRCRARARRRSRKPASNKRGDVGRLDRSIGDRGPAGVSTSTSGSRKNMPREPVRMISTAAPRACASAAIFAATLSAPSGQRRGILGDENTGHARTASTSFRQAFGVEPADHFIVEQARRANRRTGRGNKPAPRSARHRRVVPCQSMPSLGEISRGPAPRCPCSGTPRRGKASGRGVPAGSRRKS